jgi:hypothetical protein
MQDNLEPERLCSAITPQKADPLDGVIIPRHTEGRNLPPVPGVVSYPT